MKYPEFQLETYLAKREFNAPFNLCASDLETYSMNEILHMADERDLNLWNNLTLGYNETEGHPLLREEISKIYGKGFSQKEILCFAGAEEGIFCMFHTLLNPEDHAIVITPCYQSLESLPATICNTTKIQLEYQREWELDIDEIADAIQPNTKLLVINFPHNPTGALITREIQCTLVELARKHDLWIFSDEVYRFLEVNPLHRLYPFASVYEKGISLSVMSKAYGLAGLRLGWIACQHLDLLKKMNGMKHYLSICNSAPSEILSLIALKASTLIQERNRNLMQSNLKLLDQFFEDYEYLFEWIRPKGGCIGYPLFKGKMPVDHLADKLLKEAGILILPGSVYNDYRNHFRISFGRKSMPEALERLINKIPCTLFS